MNQIWLLSTGTRAKLSWGQVSQLLPAPWPVHKRLHSEKTIQIIQSPLLPARLEIKTLESQHTCGCLQPSKALALPGAARGDTWQSRAKHWPLTHSSSAQLWGEEIQSMARGKHWDSENRSVSVFIKTDKQEIPLDPILPCSSPTSGDSGAGWILQPPIPPSLQEQFVSSSLSP